MARNGFRVSLDDLAARAGVTRNLLYHYFPRGRLDVVLAVVERAERQLADEARGRQLADAGRVERPPAEGGKKDGDLDGLLTRLLDHALAPTHAWRIHRLARGAAESEIRALTEELTERIVAEAASFRRLSDPRPPVVSAALRGYVAFAEAALEESRRMRLPREEVMQLLRDTLAVLPLA